MKKEVLVKDTAQLGLANFFSQIVKVLRGLIIPKIVDPTQYGLFRSLYLVLEYSGLAHLGMHHALDKEIPYQRGKQNFQKIDLIRSTAFSFDLLASCILAALIITSSFILRFQEQRFYTLGLIAVAITVPFLILFQLFTTLLRTDNRFSPIGTSSVIFAVVGLISAVWLAIYYRALGLIISLFLTYLISDIYLFTAGKYQLELLLPKNELKPLLSLGAPLIGVQILFTVLLTIDSLAVLKFLGTESYGYYGLALTIGRALQDIPFTLLYTITPKLAEKFGESEDAKALEKLIVYPVELTSLLMPIILGSLIFFGEVFIVHIVPKYSPSLIPMRLLVLAMFFLMNGLIASQLFLAIGRPWFLFRQYVLAVLIGFILCFGFAYAGGSINEIALACLLMYFSFASIFIYSAYRYFKEKIMTRIIEIVKLSLPFGYLVLCLYFLDWVFPFKHKFIYDVLITLLKLVLLLIANVPLLFIANKKTNLFYILFTLLKRSIKIKK